MWVLVTILALFKALTTFKKEKLVSWMAWMRRTSFSSFEINSVIHPFSRLVLGFDSCDSYWVFLGTITNSLNTRCSPWASDFSFTSSFISITTFLLSPCVDNYFNCSSPWSRTWDSSFFSLFILVTKGYSFHISLIDATLNSIYPPKFSCTNDLLARSSFPKICWVDILLSSCFDDTSSNVMVGFSSDVNFTFLSRWCISIS